MSVVPGVYISIRVAPWSRTRAGRIFLSNLAVPWPHAPSVARHGGVVVTGNDPGSTTSESLWWLSSSGVRFGVENSRDARSALGLTSQPGPAPWVALRLLAPGPTLSRADALVRHDTLPTDMNPAESVVPK